MIDLPPPYRVAGADDGAALAKLVNMAGHGMPHYLWSQMAEPGEDVWDVGCRRAAKRAEAGGVIVADTGQGVVAALSCYAIGPEPEPITADLDPVIVPIQELENLAPLSWYINILAAFPDQRGKGFGSTLLRITEQVGRSEGFSKLSLIVDADNHGARRLYQRFGFVEADRRAGGVSDWRSDPYTWILMLKSIG